MDRTLAIVFFAVIVLITVVTFPEAAASVLTLTFCTAIALFLINHFSDEAAYLTRIFMVGLLLRVIIGLIIHFFELREFFGGDANTYHLLGSRLYEIWFDGVFTNDRWSQAALSMSIPGWGMHWLVGLLYSMTGPNILAAQFFCCVIGAATAPMLYGCALKIFANRQVARISALVIAVFPASVIWSSQPLKDGLIVFLLVLTMTLVLKLQEEFSYPVLLLLLFALFGITALRFYLFYVIAVAVVGSFVVGSSTNQQSMIKRIVVCLVLGFGLAFAAGENITEGLERYGNLEQIQRNREWHVKSAESGYGAELDVSTAEGAAVALPVGFAYLMFAPFPWQAANFRQAIALPETLLWTASMPFLFIGLAYTFKHRLRNAIAVILFTALLTLALSITQGNVGTAYRMRNQIQVFMFMFIAVGWQLKKEKKEIAKLESGKRRKRLEEDVRRRRDEEDGDV
jgi:hypothetical protein